ncbi:MAG: HIT family protein [Methanospirillaceae archaeon]|nr:HIT family protein [Methanospirillaceae archaeon]
MGSLTCTFCHPGPEDIILENGYAYARYDRYPVSPGHLLIIPKRHIASVFEANADEIKNLWELVSRGKEFLDAKHSPDGYNIGINNGQPAGQTIMHLHIHLIPRYVGDMEDPKGGVRGVIPGKQRY